MRAKRVWRMHKWARAKTAMMMITASSRIVTAIINQLIPWHGSLCEPLVATTRARKASSLSGLLLLMHGGPFMNPHSTLQQDGRTRQVRAVLSPAHSLFLTSRSCQPIAGQSGICYPARAFNGASHKSSAAHAATSACACSHHSAVLPLPPPRSPPSSASSFSFFLANLLA